MDVKEFREAGHRIVDRLAEYLEGVEGQRLFPDVTPRRLEQLFDEPLPMKPSSLEAVLGELEEKLLPFCTHVNHPGYFGLMTPSPTPVGVLGDLIASALNQNVGAWTIGPSATALERRTLHWLTDLVGWDDRAGGNFTSGGMTANFLGIKLGRDWVSKDRAQNEGVQGRWAVYASEERHVSIDKAVDAAGVGRQALRALPTDERFCLRLDALEEAIARDKQDGVRPMCVVGLAGTTNTGSVDPLRELRRIADREGMWLHVDAAYGGGMLLSRRTPGLLDGLELADSVTLDPHKWFYAPLDAGAILVRDHARLTRSFGLQPAYLTDELDRDGERYAFFVHGFEQSRRFRSLKVWMGFKRYGAHTLGQWIDANVEQAKLLAELVAGDPEFCVATPPLMSAICVRFEPVGLDEPALARVHREAARQIEREGRFWLSTTVLKGRHYFRINPVNLHTRPEHMRGLFESIRRTCREAASQASVR